MNFLYVRELKLMSELKDVRKSLKKSIEASPEYEKVLAATLAQPLSDGSSISPKLARAHAFKVVKSMLAGGDASDSDE
jgi:hypothetical protein